MKKFRTERDALGKFQVPLNSYAGIFTARALKHFNLTHERAHPAFILALGKVKEAAARANGALGVFDKKFVSPLVRAAQEFGSGKFPEASVVDVIQAGAGTPFNMNANEIIANRANELLGKPLGSYNPIHPNNHVNASQSSNDVIPTALRIAALFLYSPLLAEIRRLEKAFARIAQKERMTLKVGRTHLEDAVPMTVGQEFGAFATMLGKAQARFENTKDELLEVGLGGTAVGTGITAHPKFQETAIKELSEITHLKLRPAVNLFEITASANAFVSVSNACRQLAVDIVKIANDLKLLNMGPLAGIAEITLPEVEPGSSIMPGKVNPSIAEAAHMAAYDVIASDTAIALAAQAGQLQLNVMTPLIMKHLLGALDLLTATCVMLREFCVTGIVLNRRRIRDLYEKSLVTATALSPYLGYEQTLQIVKEALKKKRSIMDVVRTKKIMSDKELAWILSPEVTTRSVEVDQKLKKKLRGLFDKNFETTARMREPKEAKITVKKASS